MKEMIIVLSQTDKAALGTVRCLPGLLAAESEGAIWLRGVSAREKIDLRIRQLPGLHTYLLDADDLLFPPGRLTPVGKLQPLEWIPIDKYITVELPSSALPGKVSEQLPLKLVPSKQLRAGTALLTNLATWKAYGEQAPEVRLQQTHFAVAENNDVLIIGNPLPALPGKEYVLHDTILMPCGFEFNPPVIATLIITRFDPSKQSFLLFEPDGSWQQIPKTAFVPSTRSAIRSTKGGSDE